MKQIIIIAVAVIAIILIGVGIAVYFNSQSHGGSAAATGGASPGASAGQEAILPVAQAIPAAPTSSVIAIGTPHGTVSVKNFYISNPSTTDGGETVILESTEHYMLTYSTLDGSFWIGIDPDQFYALRSQAEQDLLSILGVSTTDACKLSVSESVFYSPTSTIASGQSFPLSFCFGNGGQ